MSEGPAGGAEPATNITRPVARLGGTVAYVAAIVILVTLIVQLLLGRVSGLQALVVGLLAVATFVLAAGLSRYGAGEQQPLLVGFAAAYSLIAATLLLLAAANPGQGDGAMRLVVVLLVAVAAVAMSVVTGRIAGLPARRLAIPYIVVALILTIVATLVVIGLDPPGVAGDRQLVMLGRLLLVLFTTGLAIAWLLGLGPTSSASPSRAESGSGRRRRFRTGPPTG